MNDYERKVGNSMHQHKRLACTLSLKSIGEAGTFAGYGSVFDVVDNQKDIVLPGAFRDTLAARGDTVKLLWQHDMGEPIGRIENIMEDENGLYVQGRLMLDLSRGREAYSLLQEGVVQGMSIGYSPVRYRIDPDTGVRLLEAVDLYEVSLVTFPANEAAQITVVKHAGDITDTKKTNEWENALECGQIIKLSDALDRAKALLK